MISILTLTLRQPDVRLIIDVADSSVEHDREARIPLYARTGVPEVWLVNLPKETIEIYLPSNLL